MTLCISMFVLSWAVLDRFSSTAAIVVSAVALVIPPFAVIIANVASAVDRRRPYASACGRAEVQARHPERVIRGDAHRGQVREDAVHAEAPPVPAAAQRERPLGDDLAARMLRGVGDHPPGLGRRGVVLHPLHHAPDAHAGIIRAPPQVAALGAAGVGDKADRRDGGRGDSPAASRRRSGLARRGVAHARCQQQCRSGDERGREPSSRSPPDPPRWPGSPCWPGPQYAQ